MSTFLDDLIHKANAVRLFWQWDNKNLIGLASVFKVYATDGSSAWLTESKGDCDGDGLRDPSVNWGADLTGQPQTNIDPKGTWFIPNKMGGSVSPGGSVIPIGTLGTAFYNGHHCHFVVHDTGPHSKFGELTPYVLRQLGQDPVHHGKYVDSGIDSGVRQLFYIGSHIGKTPIIQADIDRACEPYFQKYKTSVSP